MTSARATDARKETLVAAIAEVQRLGDRRIGTHHLFLALLHNPISVAPQVLAVDLDQARTALTDLDHRALASIGLDSAPLDQPLVTKRYLRASLTSGARHALHVATKAAHAEGSTAVEARHLLAALLRREVPDPAADLITALDIDRAVILEQLRVQR